MKFMDTMSWLHSQGCHIVVSPTIWQNFSYTHIYSQRSEPTCRWKNLAKLTKPTKSRQSLAHSKLRTWNLINLHPGNLHPKKLPHPQISLSPAHFPPASRPSRGNHPLTFPNKSPVMFVVWCDCVVLLGSWLSRHLFLQSCNTCIRKSFPLRAVTLPL